MFARRNPQIIMLMDTRDMTAHRTYVSILKLPVALP